MVKKLIRIIVTSALLVAGYLSYGRGFAFLKAHVATNSTVPILPVLTADSKTSKETTELARRAFGPNHWSVRAPLRHYDSVKGSWIYFEQYQDLGEGKRWRLWPVAVISRDRKTGGLKSIVGDEATLDFNRPFNEPTPANGDASRVVHARIVGNVNIRDDKGTPGEVADDLVIEPMNWLEYDEASELITSLDEERRVVLHQGDITVSGLGMKMFLRRRDLAGPNGVVQSNGFEGARQIRLLRSVEIDTQDVGSSGIVPGGNAKARPPALDKNGKPIPPARRPGHLQCDGEMQIDLPKSQTPVEVGPPAPALPTFAEFHRNVMVRQGEPPTADQLNSDELYLTFFPAVKPKPEEEEIDLMADTAVPESKEPLSNLELRKAVATGHAVWLQSPAEGTVGKGTRLVFDKFLPESPDRIYFWDDRYVRVEKTEFVASGKDKGKPQAINIIRNKDLTIWQYAAGGPQPSIIGRGAGTLETRPIGNDTVVERFASWQDKFEMVSEVGTDRRVIKLYDHPRISSLTQGDITARDQIIAYLKPKPKKAAASEVEAIVADGRAVPPPARPQADPASADGKSGSGDSMQIETLVALGDVHLVTVPTPADPSAKPPKKAKPRNTTYARNKFRANFLDPVEPPPGTGTRPAAKPAPAPEAATKPEAPASPAPADLDAPPPGDAVAARPADAPKPTPKPEPAEPAMDATANDVEVTLRKTFTPEGKEKNEVEEAKLTGEATVHQETPEDDPSKGGDVRGDFIHLRSKGEGKALINAFGSDSHPAIAVTPTRTIAGPILNLDQAKDYAWVNGTGYMILEQGETSILDDSAAKSDPAKANVAEVANAGDEVGPDGKPKPKAKKKKPPMTIAWGRGPRDPKARMRFFGRPADGQQGPAKAYFDSHVTGQTDESDPNRDDDSSFVSETLVATFDGPIAFVRPKPEGARDPAEKKEPQRQIAFLDWTGKVEIVSRKYNPETHLLESKKKIVGPHVTYEKKTGKFVVDKVGTVDLYNRETDSNDKDKDKKKSSNPFGPIATSSKPRDPKLANATLKLTHVDFKKGMEGRMAPEKGSSPDDYSIANFKDAVAVNGTVPDQDATIDVEGLGAPDDYYRVNAHNLQVISEPPPKKGEPDRTLLATWGESTAYTKTKTIQGERITYDSLSQLTYVYGGNYDVNIVDQSSPGQPYTSASGSAVRHDHLTGQTKLLDPREFEIVDPSSGTRAASIYADLPPAAKWKGYPSANPPKVKKPRDPNDTMTAAGRIKLPPRSNLERRGFYGR